VNGPDLVTARLDALKIGLSIGVGSGGVVALYLSWRRQDSTERTLAHQQDVHTATMAHQDRVARATEHDAAERRLSELYLKAVEQLGSSQAAVRQGGPLRPRTRRAGQPAPAANGGQRDLRLPAQPLHPATGDQQGPPAATVWLNVAE
jgi:hypothetical protein